MALPARKTRPDRNPHNWILGDRAAKLLGLNASTVSWRCRGDLEPRGLARKGPSLNGGRECWYVDRSVDPRLSERTLADLSGYPADRVFKAQRRRDLLQRFQDACDKRFADESQAQVYERFRKELAADGADCIPSRRCLQAWDRKYRRAGLVGLIDKSANRSAARVGNEDGTPARDPQGIAYFYSQYRTQQRLSISKCHGRTLREAGRQGWSWPESASSTALWLREHDDRATTYLFRYGYDAWRSRYMPYLEQDYTSLTPGQLFVCDHHQFKMFVRHKGKVLRPWLTAIEDADTRVLVGWHIGPGAHSDAIIQSIYNAFTRWGVPQTVKIDNGRDYDSKVITGTTKTELRQLRQTLGPGWQDAWRREQAKVELYPESWLGILPEAGCNIVRAIPYEPQSKLIERLFRTVTDDFVREWPTFCDTDPARKPEALKDVMADPSAIPLLDDVAREFPVWLDEYHARPHRGDGMNGLSPQQKWNSSSVKPAVADERALALLCRVRGAYRVGANGVRVKVGSTTIGYGQYSPQLSRYKGRDVLVAVDASDVSRAVIFTPNRDKRQLICIAPANRRYSPNTTVNEIREAHAEINRARRDAKRARASAATRMKDVARVSREHREQRHHELRATGTDDQRPGGPIRVALTGLEEVSSQLHGATPIEHTEPDRPGSALGDLLEDATDLSDWITDEPEDEPTDGTDEEDLFGVLLDD